MRARWRRGMLALGAQPVGVGAQACWRWVRNRRALARLVRERWRAGAEVPTGGRALTRWRGAPGAGDLGFLANLAAVYAGGAVPERGGPFFVLR